MKKVAIQIKAIIKKYQELCKINNCYFVIDATVKKTNDHGELHFALGPSFHFENVWTLSELNGVRRSFYKEIAACLTKTEFEAVEISTTYGIHSTWAATGYELRFITAPERI